MTSIDFLLRSGASFAAGILSFLSPCVFPLVPSYLAILAGSSVRDLESGDNASLRKRILLRALCFSLGFSAVFILLGLVFSQAGAMIGGGGRLWSSAAGTLVVLLGINTAFDLVSILNMERRFHVEGRPDGFLPSFLFGAAFGAGWSPCVGPILASILFLAGSGSLLQAAALLGVYSLGLALPFLAAGLFFGRLKSLLEALKRRMAVVKKLAGLLLVLIGLYMIFGNLRTLSADFVRLGYGLQDFTAANPQAARIGAAFFHLLAATAALVFAQLRRRAGKRARAAALSAALFTLLSALEAAGLLSTTELLAAWLLFSGI